MTTETPEPEASGLVTSADVNPPAVEEASGSATAAPEPDNSPGEKVVGEHGPELVKLDELPPGAPKYPGPLYAGAAGEWLKPLRDALGLAEKDQFTYDFRENERAAIQAKVGGTGYPTRDEWAKLFN